MIVQLGKNYYVIVHAYHHFIGTLQEITGKREGDFVNNVRIQSCSRDWTSFFNEGMKDDTVHHFFPDGNYPWLAIFKWDHPVPENKRDTRKRR